MATRAFVQRREQERAQRTDVAEKAHETRQARLDAHLSRARTFIDAEAAHAQTEMHRLSWLLTRGIPCQRRLTEGGVPMELAIELTSMQCPKGRMLKWLRDIPDTAQAIIDTLRAEGATEVEVRAPNEHACWYVTLVWNGVP